MEENSGKACNDLFGLKMWRNLNILRETSRKVRTAQSNSLVSLRLDSTLINWHCHSIF